MAKATPEDVYYSPFLTNLSIAYRQRQEKFVATRFAPVVPTSKQSALYEIFSKADFMRDEAVPREPGKESAGISFGISRDSYNCLLYAIHYDITREMRVARASLGEAESALKRVGMQL